MDPASLSALVSELLLVIHMLSGYPPPGVLPEIQLVSQSVMQAEICGAPCPIRAYYHPTRGIFIDETLDVAHDPFARSILLHELVHYVQAVSGRFDPTLDPCVRYNTAEAEAYTIQNRYLMRINDTHRVVMSGWAMMRCHPAEVSSAR